MSAPGTLTVDRGQLEALRDAIDEVIASPAPISTLVVEVADLALAVLRAAGGIHGRRELVERLGVTPARVRQLTGYDSFPKRRGTINGEPFWFGAEVYPWRAMQLSSPTYRDPRRRRTT
jgi:hypothetical protein